MRSRYIGNRRNNRPHSKTVTLNVTLNVMASTGRIRGVPSGRERLSLDVEAVHTTSGWVEFGTYVTASLDKEEPEHEDLRGEKMEIYNFDRKALSDAVTNECLYDTDGRLFLKWSTYGPDQYYPTGSIEYNAIE